MRTFYHQQPILTLGQPTPSLLKLTHGSVTLFDLRDNPFATFSAPHVLNLTQVLCSCPALKTIRANGKCHVVKIKIKESHRGYMRKLKEQGLRKNNFHVFGEVGLGCFYELARFGEFFQCRKQQKIALKEEHLYLIVKGKLVLNGEEIPLKLVQMDSGEVINVTKRLIIQALTDDLNLFTVPVSIAAAILGQQYPSITIALEPQKQSISLFQARNERLSHEIKARRTRNTHKTMVPVHFANPVEQKQQQVQKYCRARSCLSHTNKTRKAIRSQNQARFRQLIELNRKKYGQEYLCQKRMEVSRNIEAMSSHNSPTASPVQQAPMVSMKQLVHSVYSSFELRQEYAVLKSHPVIQRWQKAHRSGKLRKVGWKDKENWGRRQGRQEGKEGREQLIKTNLSLLFA